MQAISFPPVRHESGIFRFECIKIVSADSAMILESAQLVKLLANEDTLLRTDCCGQIVADTNVSPFARARSICCGHKFCVRDTKNVSDFVQKHLVSAANVSQFAHARKHHEQQCVRNNVSLFASTFI